jgi:hypothetical protein
VIKKANQTKQQEEISEVLLTRSLGRFVGVVRLLPRSRHTRFRSGGLRDGRTWREGVFSFKHRRCNETNKYHATQQSPHENDWFPGHENPHGRTSQGQRAQLTSYLYCTANNPHLFRKILFI